MAKQDIIRGASPGGGGDGENLYITFGKCINNFTELYDAIAAGAIKTAYESNSNTEAFTTTEQSKLAGITAAATPTNEANVVALTNRKLLQSYKKPLHTLKDGLSKMCAQQ